METRGEERITPTIPCFGSAGGRTEPLSQTLPGVACVALSWHSLTTLVVGSSGQGFSLASDGPGRDILYWNTAQLPARCRGTQGDRLVVCAVGWSVVGQGSLGSGQCQCSLPLISEPRLRRLSSADPVGPNRDSRQRGEVTCAAARLP